MTTLIHRKWREYKRRPETLLLMLLLFAAYQAGAQAASPYSRFGLGYLAPTDFSANLGMGGITAAYTSSRFINSANPASYASLTMTTAEIGAVLDGNNIHTRDSSYNAFDGGIDHVVFAFVPHPKKNNWAVAIGLLPYSYMNYSLAQYVNDPVLGQYNQVTTGEGSLYQAFVGGAYKVKGFAIGANVGYIFGKLSYQQQVIFPDSTGDLNTSSVTNLNVKGFTYTLGVTYQKLIYRKRDDVDPRSNIFIYAGLYGSSGVTLHATITSYWQRFTYDVNNNLLVTDTVQYNLTQQGKITMPYNVAGGVMVGNELFWLIGADFKYTNWSAFSSPISSIVTGDQLNNSWVASIGGQITPKYGDRKFTSNIQYRVGAYFGQSEATFNGEALKEYAGTFGIGIPLKRFAMFNFSGQVGSRGNSGDATAPRENFYRLVFGLTLNDVWFIKRKFD